VLQGGDWTEQLTSALQKLNCCLLDCQLLSQLLHCPALQPFVQQPTAAGVLDALAAVDSAAAAAVGRSGGGSQKPLRQLLQMLTAAERHHLRTYLLQRKWFAPAAAAAAPAAAALTQGQLQLLRMLPIYEVHPALPFEDTKSQLQQQQQSASTSSINVANAQDGLHCALVQADRAPLLLAPKGISSTVLGSRFLRCESAAEEDLLQQHLGVQRLPMSAFLAQHLAAAPQQLNQRGLVSSVVYVLQNLQQLAQEDPSLPTVLG
jgi:sacsin